MRIVSPSIEIISKDSYEDILKSLEMIGRTCYKSEDKIKEGSAEKFLAAVVKSGHESVIEHKYISVRVVCDRGVTHEIVRHRLASYSQESTRYCNYTKDKFCREITVIDISTGFNYNLTDPVDREKYYIWNDAMRYAEKAYFKMIEVGAKPDEARSVLPNSLKTEIVMTMNFREWRHFLGLRLDPHAHPQIREVSRMILDEFYKRYPVFFEDLVKSE